MEMALQLQQQGSSGSVESLVMIEGSHSFVAAYVDRMLSKNTEASKGSSDIEIQVICGFVAQFAVGLARSVEVCYFGVRHTMTATNHDGHKQWPSTWDEIYPTLLNELYCIHSALVFTVRRYASHGISYRNSVRPSVRPSVCHTRALCPHGSTYDHDFFTIL